jgi:hypothetical protein
MTPRAKQPASGGERQPDLSGSWLVGLMVGMTLTNLAVGAIILGAGAAIGQAILKQDPSAS